LVKRAQEDAFYDEQVRLKKGTKVARNSGLKAQYPYLKDEITLVGGRLENSGLPSEQRYPIVLPYQHEVTKLIFQDYLSKLMHCGPQLLLSEIRQVFLPIKGRIIARSTVLKCVQCVRANPKF